MAVSIAAVVSLLGVSTGFERSWTEVYEGRAVDLMVVRAGVAERLTSNLDEQLTKRLLKLPHVEAVVPTLTDMVSLGEGSLIGMPLHGWPAGSFAFNSLRITSGESLGEGDRDGALLGRALADNLHKSVGEEVEIELHKFRVKGIFESSSVFENGSAVVLLGTLQELMDRPGQVTEFQVAVDRSVGDLPATIADLRVMIEDLRGENEMRLGLAALPVKDYVSTATEVRLAHAMAWVTSVIAVSIASIGILNTMFMSVMERTQEIGVLRALGWPKSRVIRMILGESFILSLAGAVVGVLGAVALTATLSQWSTVHGYVRAAISPEVVAAGFGLSLIVGLAGGIYPAMFGASLSPTEALRYE